MKKYKLVIPEKITKDQITIAKRVLNEDGQIFEAWDSAIPKEWLHEVKEPITAEEWTENLGFKGMCENGSGYRFPQDVEAFLKVTQLRAFKAGEENQKLRHKPKETFEDKYGRVITHTTSSKARFWWNAALQNYGIIPE